MQVPVRVPKRGGLAHFDDHYTIESEVQLWSTNFFISKQFRRAGSPVHRNDTSLSEAKSIEGRDVAKEDIVELLPSHNP